MQIITTATIKGGTGKSTTTAALAQAATDAGAKALVIDLDPQANSTFFIGADQNRPGAYQLLHGEDPDRIIQETPQGIAAIAASPDLATERTTPGSAKRLQAAIEPIKKRFDYIFIDTPPHIGELTFNALQAATGLIIPLETDSGSLQGLYQITDIANQMRTSNPDLSIIGIILTRYDSRPKINRYLRGVIEDRGREIGVKLLMGIHTGVAIREAQGLQRSIYEYAPRSNPAGDYKTLFRRIERWEDGKTFQE